MGSAIARSFTSQRSPWAPSRGRLRMSPYTCTLPWCLAVHSSFARNRADQLPFCLFCWRRTEAKKGGQPSRLNKVSPENRVRHSGAQRQKAFTYATSTPPSLQSPVHRTSFRIKSGVLPLWDQTRRTSEASRPVRIPWCPQGFSHADFTYAYALEPSRRSRRCLRVAHQPFPSLCTRTDYDVTGARRNW